VQHRFRAFAALHGEIQPALSSWLPRQLPLSSKLIHSKKDLENRVTVLEKYLIDALNGCSGLSGKGSTVPAALMRFLEPPSRCAPICLRSGCRTSE